MDLQENFKNHALLDFYFQYMDEEKFLVIRNHVLFVALFLDTIVSSSFIKRRMQNQK